MVFKIRAHFWGILAVTTANNCLKQEMTNTCFRLGVAPTHLYKPLSRLISPVIVRPDTPTCGIIFLFVIANKERIRGNPSIGGNGGRMKSLNRNCNTNGAYMFIFQYYRMNY